MASFESRARIAGVVAIALVVGAGGVIWARRAQTAAECRKIRKIQEDRAAAENGINPFVGSEESLCEMQADLDLTKAIEAGTGPAWAKREHDAAIEECVARAKRAKDARVEFERLSHELADASRDLLAAHGAAFLGDVCPRDPR